MNDAPVVCDYHIGEGGLLRRFEVAAHLTRLHWQLLALLAITWVPIVVLGVWLGHAEALLYDPAVHVRLLLVAPVLLILDHLFPPVCRYTLAQLQSQAFVPRAAQARLDRLLRTAARWADSSLPEAILVLFAWGLGVAALRGVVPIRGLSNRAGLAPDQIWYALTDLPLFQFLLWRSVWRWAIWVRILAGLARINLDLVPTHPDRCGGIRFLSLPSIGYCAMLLFALSSVLCAEWETRATLGATLDSFSPLLLVFATAGTLVAFGPLLLFSPQLYRARKRGMLELGSYATECGRRVRKALLEGASCGAGEREGIHTLASAEQTYRETVNQLNLLLFKRNDLLLLLAATLVPVVPTMLRHVPFEDWRAITGLITGWKP